MEYSIERMGKFMMRKNQYWFGVILTILGIAGMLAGCGKKKEPITDQAFLLNTFVTITIYDSGNKGLIQECFSRIEEYENILSSTREGSEIYEMNHRSADKQTWEVSADTRRVLDKGLYYSQLSEGKFDITVAPLTALWDFTGDNPHVPGQEQIDKAVEAVGYQNLKMDGNQVLFLSTNTQIDLGGIAKGYIADQIKDYLVSRGVKSAIINLGGNVLCIGDRPDETPFRVGVQSPFADQQESALLLNIKDQAVVSSGTYERQFTENGKVYHHILDPFTGYPYENGISSVTIICDQAVDGDGLSTACFSLGLEEGKKLLDSMEDAVGIFIMQDGSIEYSQGAQELVFQEEPNE